MAAALPDPGVYHDITDAVYRALPYANFSHIKLYADSPARAQHVAKHGMKQTPAMFLGEMLHCMVLERHEFPNRFELWDGADRELKNGSVKRIIGTDTPEYRERLEDATQRGVRLYGVKEQGELLGMSQAVAASSDAVRILDSPTITTEVVVIWDDAKTGVRCKAKIDFANFSARVCGDLKSAQSAAPEAFGRTVAQMYYHAQAAMYSDALDAFHPGGWAWKWIAVEKSKDSEGENPMHAVGVYDADVEALEIGRHFYRKWLAMHKRCTDDGRWPSYGATAIALPAWHVRQVEDAIYEEVTG